MTLLTHIRGIFIYCMIFFLELLDSSNNSTRNECEPVLAGRSSAAAVRRDKRAGGYEG